MKRLIVLLALAVLIFNFSTCEFTIPTAIVIEGNPDFTLTGNYNTGPMFKEMIDELFAGYDNDGPVKIYDCVNEPVYTMLVYIELLTENFHFTNKDVILAAMDAKSLLGQPEEIEHDNIVFLGIDYPEFEFPVTDPDPESVIQMPSLDLDDILGKFKFDGLEGRLYIYGHPILNVLSIKLDKDSINELTPNTKPTQFDPLLTLDSDGKYPTEYLGVKPTSGHDMTSLIKDDGLENFTINFGIKNDALITREMVETDADIKVVLAVWLPLKLTASEAGNFELFDFGKNEEEVSNYKDDNEDGICDICGEQEYDCTCGSTIVELEIEDVLGRTEPGGLMDNSLELKNLTLRVTTGKDIPFQKSSIKISSGEALSLNYFEEIIPLKNRTLSLSFSSEKMNRIMNTYPFAPKIEIVYDNGAVIEIPRELEITKLEFEAGFSMRLEF